MLRLRGSNVTQEDIERRRRYVKDMGREGEGEGGGRGGWRMERGQREKGREGERREGRGGRGRGGNCD